MSGIADLALASFSCAFERQSFRYAVEKAQDESVTSLPNGLQIEERCDMLRLQTVQFTVCSVKDAAVVQCCTDPIASVQRNSS